VFEIENKRGLKSALLVGTAVALGLGIQAAAAEEIATETVVVTGSRIPNRERQPAVDRFGRRA